MLRLKPMLDLRQLSELKARKAKFGFQGRVLTTNFEALGMIINKARELEPNILFELNFNMGHNEYKLYTNDSIVAEYIRENFCTKY